MLFHALFPRERPALAFSAVLVTAVVASGAALDQLARQRAVLAGPTSPSAVSQQVQRALAAARASWEVRQLAQWIVENQDHGQAPFLVVDKAQARLYAFDASGEMRASAGVLLGASRSDAVQPAATPAGRFAAQDRGGALARLVWAGGGAELELYGTHSHHTPGRFASRLASGEADDKRISDGSLHVAPDFFREHLAALRGRPSTLYVLPESSTHLAGHDVPALFRRPS